MTPERKDYYSCLFFPIFRGQAKWFDRDVKLKMVNEPNVITMSETSRNLGRKRIFQRK